LLYAFFWVISRCLKFKCQRFRTFCLFHFHRRASTYTPMKMEQTVYSETLAYTIQTPGIPQEENIQHSEHGESLKPKNLTWLSLIQPSDWVKEKIGQIRIG
jgi:hypothetical protein